MAGLGRRVEAGVHTFVWLATLALLFYFVFSRGVALLVPGLEDAGRVPWFTALIAGASLFLAFLDVLLLSPMRNGHTLGQWLAGIRLAGPDRRTPGGRAWALRTLSTLIQAVTLVAAVPWLWLAARGNSLSDRISGTRQVREDRNPHWIWKLSPITALALVILAFQRAGAAILAVPDWGWHMLGAVCVWLLAVYGWKYIKMIRP